MLYFFIFIFGLAVGSFLNVVIFRLEKDKLVLSGRSKCSKCGEVLEWRDLIPLFSFFWQKGRCRHCGQKISWQYPIVEIATALLFLLIFSFDFAQDKNFINLVYHLAIVSFLTVIFVYDLKHYLIPDKIVYLAIGLSLLYCLFAVPGSLFSHVLSGLGAAVFFLLLVIVSSGRWMGLGDVKLAFLLGLFLDWPLILAALFLAFFSGAASGITLIILGKKKMKSEVPFGPFLTGSTILVFLFEPFFQSVLENLFI